LCVAGVIGPRLVISIQSFPVRTLTPSFLSSFCRAEIRSDSFILKFSMFTIRVFSPFGVANAERIANVITKSGSAFMSIFPRDLRIGCPVILRTLFRNENFAPI